MNAQNLVPNGDFETYSSCPIGSGQYYLATPWTAGAGTPDYYNGCATYAPHMGVPNQGYGFWQEAHSGNAYMGIWTYHSGKEYIKVTLSDSLRNSRCYSVSFYANLMNLLRFGVNNLGAYISQTPFLVATGGVLNYPAQILLPGNPAIVDTVSWIKVSGVYAATGGEQCITIGNFNYDSTTTIQVINPANPYAGAYYYIDDVSIYEIKAANAGRDTAICQGDSVMLGTTSYEGVTYSWLPTAGLSNASIGNPMASPATNTTYYLTQTTPCATTVDSVVVSLGDCTVGVNELGIKNEELGIYPNPTIGVFTISTTGSKIKEVRVYDVLGQMINDKWLTINGSDTTIDISGVSKGIYFVEIKTEKGIVRKKIVKQ